MRFGCRPFQRGPPSLAGAIAARPNTASADAQYAQNNATPLLPGQARAASDSAPSYHGDIVVTGTRLHWWDRALDWLDSGYNTLASEFESNWLVQRIAQATSPAGEAQRYVGPAGMAVLHFYEGEAAGVRDFAVGTAKGVYHLFTTDPRTTAKNLV